MIDKLGRRILIVLLVAILALLFAMAYQNSAMSAESRTYNISVLVKNPNERFRKGLDKAALDYNVDVHLITIGEQDGAAQQETYLKRELENNTDAIVLQAADVDAIQAFLSETSLRVPMVTYERELQHGNIVAHMGIDDHAFGERLGELVAERGEGRTCMIIAPKAISEEHVARMNGAYAVLQEKGIPCFVLYCEEGDIARLLAGREELALAAIDESLLLPLCEQARSTDILFGAGYTSAVRTQLESGRIRALVIYSEFDMGYLSLRAAALAANGETIPKLSYTFHVADAGNMYETPVEQILFPID